MIAIINNRTNEYGITKSSITPGKVAEYKSGDDVRSGIVQRVAGKAVLLDGGRQTHWRNVTEVR